MNAARIVLRTHLTLTLLVAGMQFGNGADQCVTCHEAIEDPAVRLFRDDVHFKRGLGCVDCHGGDKSSDDAEISMSRRAGFVGVTRGDSISVMCGTCHANAGRMKSLQSSIRTDQLSLLHNSVHGKASTKGGERIVQCTTCHNAHGIRAVRDRRSPVHPLNVVATCAHCHGNPTYMGSYNPSLPVDQLEKYRSSRHGLLNAKGDSKVAECSSCHGSHGIFPADDVRSSVFPTNLPSRCASCHGDPEYMKDRAIPTDQMEQYRSSTHGKALLEKNDLAAPACNDCHGNHAATPPGIESISKVCGTCHALNDELFSASKHKKVFDDLGLPECETCHGNHAIVSVTSALLGTDESATCSRCHDANQDTAGFAFAKGIRLLVDSLDALYAHSVLLVEEARQKGMELGEAEFHLREARQSRLEARTVIHGFDMEKTSSVLFKGLTITGDVSDQANDAIDEYYFRRAGLGVATLIISILALSLYLFIRRIERVQANTASLHPPGSSK